METVNSPSRSASLPQIPYPWLVLGVSYLLMLFFAFPLQALPPLMEQIRADIPFSNSLAGLLMGAYGAPGLFMPVAAAMLAMRYDQKMLIIVSLWIIAFGLILFAAGTTFWMLFTGRLVAGVGAKIILSLAPLFVISAFEKRTLGTIIGFFNTAVPVGSITAINLFGYAGSVIGWREATASLVGITILIVFIVSLFLILPEAPTRETEKSADGVKLEPELLLLSLLNLLLNAVTLSYITFAPEYFVSLGISAAHANLLSSLIIVEMAVLGPLAGMVADRGGNEKKLLISSALIMAASLAVLGLPGVPLLVPVIAVGAGAAVVPVVVFPMLREVIAPERMSIGIAILIIASNIGSTVGPFLTGLALDLHGYRGGFSLLAALSLLILPVTFRLPGSAPRSDPR